MADSRIGVRYARALFALAGETKAIEPVRNDLIQLQNLLAQVPELSQVLESPVVRGRQKSKLVKALMGESLNPLTQKFLDLLIDHHREDCLADACRMYNRLYKEDKGIVEANLSSVLPLHDELIASLRKWLAGQLDSTIEMTISTDEDLIGGFVLRMDDQQLDASVKTYLKKIKNELRQVLN